MGPVSFQQIGKGLDPERLRALARVLTAAGIRVRLTDADTALLVRAEDVARCRDVMAEADGSPENRWADGT